MKELFYDLFFNGPGAFLAFTIVVGVVSILYRVLFPSETVSSGYTGNDLSGSHRDGGGGSCNSCGGPCGH